MVGTINKVIDLNNGQKLITYKDIDTTPGQSGSPVYLYNADESKINTQIGVHVGYDQSSK